MVTFLDFPAWNVFPQKSPWAIFSDLLWVAESSSPTPQYPRSILLSPLTHLHRDSGKHRIIPCPPLLLLNLKNMKHACPRPVLMLFPPPAPLGTVPREAHLPSAPCSSAMGGAPMDLVEPALAGQWLDLCMDPGLAEPSPPPRPAPAPGGAGFRLLLLPQLHARLHPLVQFIFSSAPGAWHLFSSAFSLPVGSCWDLKRLYLCPFTYCPACSLEAGPAGSWTPGPGCMWGLVRGGWVEVLLAEG